MLPFKSGDKSPHSKTDQPFLFAKPPSAACRGGRMKTGILGGSFDPVHGGHVAMALEAARALALDRIISLQPDSVPALRERGMLAARLGSVESAREDFTRLLELVPQSPDAESIRARLAELRAKQSPLN